MKNYKIHVIFAYYYKTILLSFITKRKQERDTQNKTHTQTRPERYTER